MKIAYISQAYPPIISGASFMVERLAQGMADRGNSVIVLTASDKGHAYSEQYTKLQIVRLKSTRNPKRAYQKFVPWSYRAIKTNLVNFKPDLIHTHDVLNLGVFGLIIGRHLDIPVIGTIHQLPWFICVYLPGLPGLQSAVEGCLWHYGRLLNKYFQLMIVPTETISQFVSIHGGFRPAVLSNGIDVDIFQCDQGDIAKKANLFEKYHLKTDCPIILHVGRLDSDKKVDVVIRAAAKVIKRIPAQLLVVGDGECRKRLISLASQLGIGEHCQFPGFVDMNSDLPDLYRISAVFTTASEIETQGLVLLEAMASGLPIVAVDATCIHEVVKHQKTGFLVPPGDENMLAEGMINLMEYPARARQMGEAGRSLVQAYSTQNSLDRHERIYRDTVTRYQPVRTGRSILSFLMNDRS